MLGCAHLNICSIGQEMLVDVEPSLHVLGSNLQANYNAVLPSCNSFTRTYQTNLNLTQPKQGSNHPRTFSYSGGVKSISLIYS
jgi:hypothetical protein